MITADRIVPNTEKVGPIMNKGTTVSSIEKMIPRVTIDITIPSKKKVNLAIKIAENRDKIFLIIELSKKHSLLKYLVR